jgi:peptidoglycan hydrolase-like protein with peptidoglycan-binding domain
MLWGDSLRLAVKQLLIAAAVVALFAGITPAETHSAKPSTAKSKSVRHKTSKHRRARKGAWKHHGQQKIDAARATEIQQALIRQKYLDGQPSGKWDARTEAAMARYQADNGWQSKVTPDSRAIIKLGLGPNHQSDLQNLDVKPSTDAIASTGSSSGTTTSKQ